MNKYKVLKQQVFNSGEYTIVSIRREDRNDIMKWRNEQMYHLRQNEPLTKEKQEAYFDHVISNLFEEEKPGQILFSYLKGDKCIGYGGLVHINWIDKNAEISFIMNTELEEEHFSKHWTVFLELIEQVAFKDLNFHKLFTYAFDLRPHIYEVIENAGFVKEATLKEHCFFNGVYKDVIMHGKFNKSDHIIV
jgi:RimJ/RimL family protein N-acetyltransferase